MDVVVVESPAKAKTINKYLGTGYKVLASYGHVRDLPSKDGSVRPDADFDMSWEVDARAEKHLKSIAEALKGADNLYLATDPDREGEAISWHVREVLDQRRALDDVQVSRVVFHEITKDAVLEALANPRELHDELVEAYLARRALDYLVGFTLSPVLWRKLPGARSAGRVQSVALRLICDREAEIEAFKPREYWTVEAALRTGAGAPVPAKLTHLDGQKLDRYDLGNEEQAKSAAAKVEAGAFSVAEIERKTVSRHPNPPFTTSTLQQEASRKLGFSASRTMRLAQSLYEGVELGGETVGLITYMRTDSVQLASVAVDASRRLIASSYGAAYVPDKPRVYKSKAKNAQEAHEAIRPTDLFRRPQQVAAYVEKDALRLYELIWKRTVASAMQSAQLEQVAVDFADGAGTQLRANGSVIKFDGFLKVYQEGRDDSDSQEGDDERVLPDMAKGEALTLETVTPEQHFTKPPPRYSEASLVKMLEELGIGRPSTYASILGVLQDRNYVRMDKRRFIAEDRGRLVTAFLSGFFHDYVQDNFTAELEDKLDDISNGGREWKAVLREFWSAFSKAVDETKDLTIRNVLDALDADLGPHFFPEDGNGANPRACPACADGRLGLKLGKHGAFIGCSNYPDCNYTRALAVAGQGEAETLATPRALGTDPDSGLEMTLRKGPYGLYLQLGETPEKGSKAPKPKRVALPKGQDPDALDFDTALGLLSLPRTIGTHPDSGEPITAGIGRFGPYLKHKSSYASIPADENVLTIGLNRAVTLIAEKASRGAAGLMREIGAHPEDGKPVGVYRGRYGPYVKHGRINATLPKTSQPETVTLDEAVALLKTQAEKKKSAKGGGKKTPAKKTTTKKTSAKKTGAKKAPAKKSAKTSAAKSSTKPASPNGADSGA